jgi:Domain of unknown function (DUF4440)
MRRALLAAVAAALLLASTAYGGPSDTDELVHLEHRWLAAAMQRDTSVLDEILADDFIDVNSRGEVRDKADHLRSTSAPAHTRQTLGELKVRIYGPAAVVTGLNTIAAPDGSFTARVRFTDVFVKRDGRWRAVSAQETLEKNS